MERSEHYFLTRSKEFILSPNEEARVDLKLKVRPFPPKTNVTGKVSSGGYPFNNATVKILDSRFDPVKHVLTNTEGIYLFENLPPGNYKLTATAPGYQIANLFSFSLKPNETVIIDFNLKEDKNVRDKNCIYGRITEFLAQKAIEDAEIKLFSAPSHYLVAEVHSNEDGQYLFCAVPAGEYAIVASKHGFTTSDLIRIKAEQGQLIKIDFQLHQSNPTSGTVSGVITAAFGQEPSGVCVGLFSVRPDGETLIQIKTTITGGIYLFSDVPPGEYVVKAKQNEQWHCVQERTIHPY